MKKCPGCSQTPKIEHCQSCYLAEKMRRERVEKEVARLMYYVDELIAAIKEI